jgi:hypothetical protein
MLQITEGKVYNYQGDVKDAKGKDYEYLSVFYRDNSRLTIFLTINRTTYRMFFHDGVSEVHSEEACMKVVTKLTLKQG